MTSASSLAEDRAEPLRRVQLLARGAVQGVGFRPFVFQLASELGLRGWVSNSSGGLLIEAESSQTQLELFIGRLRSEKPAASILESLEDTWLPVIGYESFEIRPSQTSDLKRALVLPDLATCPECLREIADPANRRFQYAFTNCTHCGPRFTILESLPYDRARTSMKGFPMCPQCQMEYDDPRNRRFHAQPNACPECGPELALWDGKGQTLARGPEALTAAAAELLQGAVVAVKGLGGFHLMVAAHLDASIERLRRLKAREEKPFALMFPCMEQVHAVCAVSALEGELLLSPAAPIVLLRRHLTECHATSCQISNLVAPSNPYLGVMLPATPLHHLLMKQVAQPLIATSGNLAEEPICIDETEALERLGRIADLFLVHNRPIVRHADDSIVRIMAGREMMLRRARGYAPLPITVASPENAAASAREEPATVQAVGGQLKNTTALAIGERAFLSQHIGDLETPQAQAAFQRVLTDFQAFYDVSPSLLVADAHPDYVATRYARQSGRPLLLVQHHYAHVLACMAEHGLHENVLGISWDGTGYGADGTVWGGEFLRITASSYSRFAHFRTFRLPGGEAAVREPRRAAFGLLYELLGRAVLERQDLAPIRAWSRAEAATLATMLERQINSPLTSSAGRLFDAVAALLHLRQRSGFEGQAAMDLEFAAGEPQGTECYSLEVTSPGLAERGEQPAWIVDWGPLITRLLDDLQKDLPAGMISRKVHHGLIEAAVRVAKMAGHPHVVLSGGCFQNRYLTEGAVLRLRQEGFEPFWHRRVPPNDGGLALGQVLAARRQSFVSHA